VEQYEHGITKISAMENVNRHNSRFDMSFPNNDGDSTNES